MTSDSSWLDLLERDAPAAAFFDLGARLRAEGRPGAQDTESALRLKLLLQQRAHRVSELAALNDIARRLSALHAPEDVLAEIVDRARELLGVDLAYLGLVEDAPDPAMRIAVASGALRRGLVELTVPLHTSLAGRVILQAAPFWVSDYSTATEFRHDEAADTVAVSERMRGLLGVPLVVRGSVIGALFACKRSERTFSAEEVALLSGLASHAAIAIDTARAIDRLGSARDELALRTAELERAAVWTEQLTQLVLRGGGVDDLLGQISAVVSAPVEFVRTGVEADLERADGGGPTSVVRRVRAGGRDFGTLVLRPDGEPRREDVNVVDQAVPVLALALVAEDAVAEAVRFAQDSLLSELLTGEAGDGDRRAQARRAGLDPGLPCLVVVVDTVDGLAETRRRVEALAWPPGTRMTACRGRLAVLVRGEAPGVVERLWTAGGLPTAGVAGPTFPGNGLATSHRTAVETLTALQALGLTGEVRTAEQLGIFRVLLTETGRGGVMAAFDRALGAVAAEQERRGVPLLDTLEHFLAENQRPGPAARRLDVHVNTLYQRLGTLDRLLGEHWRSPERALELGLLVRLRRAGAATSRRTGA